MNPFTNSKLLNKRICERPDFRRDARRVCLWNLKFSDESLGRDETPHQTCHEHFSSVWQLFIVCINLSCERTVGNPSAIEGQTVNIKNLWTGLWAFSSPVDPLIHFNLMNIHSCYRISMPLNRKNLFRLSFNDVYCSECQITFFLRGRRNYFLVKADRKKSFSHGNCVA